MPELAHGEWEHLFEPWFAKEAPYMPAPQAQVSGPESVFGEASQPLAVRRQDYVRRQSPIERALELRNATIAAEMERLVAYAERRHHGVELAGAADRVRRPPLRDAALRRLELPTAALASIPSTTSPSIPA